MPALVLFDLDGTLTDSAPGIIDALHYALDQLGLDRPDEQTLRSFLGPPLAVTFAEYYQLDNRTIDEGIGHYRERYAQTSVSGNSVFPGIPELLSELGNYGVTLATATSKPTETAREILEHFDLLPHFTFIGGATMSTERIRKADVIAHTLANLPGHETVVMIGDRHHDIAGAQAHGLPSIGVTWGYGDTKELSDAGAHHIAHEPVEVLHALVALGVMPQSSAPAR